MGRKPKERIGRMKQTEVILGRPAGAAIDESDRVDRRWVKHYRRLLAMRDALIDQERSLVNAARESLPDPIQDTPSEVANEDHERDVAFGRISYDQSTLVEINAAIERILAGTYGTCEATGRPIPKERLEAMPWTRFSLEAQREIERRTAESAATIGPLRGLEEMAAREAEAVDQGHDITMPEQRRRARTRRKPSSPADETRAGRIAMYSRPAGPPSPQDFEDRAEEIAESEGLDPGQVNEGHAAQARGELIRDSSGEVSADETVEFANTTEPVAARGRKIRTVRLNDEEEIAETLVSEGLEEALHEEMREADGKMDADGRL